MNRTILHCDLNGFFASVECIGRPELKKVPMAVCGNPENRHGIILAKNELAKGYGVKTAETVWQARRKCPDLVLVTPHYDKYSEYSKLVNQIYLRYTDRVEPFGIDESWLDVTSSEKLFGTGRQIADALRETVKKELDLTISVGVSFNKVFAKLGSDLRKPDATTEITRENFRKTVWPLPVRSLLYVGRSAAETLSKLGIRTIGDLAVADPKIIAGALGKLGEQIRSYAAGEDDSPVRLYTDSSELKSVGNSMTFSRDLVGESDVRAGVIALADTVAARMREYGVMCTTVQVQIKDPNLKTISRQKPLPNPSQLAREISKAAMDIIRASWNMNAPIRLLSVTGTNLVPQEEASEQITLFDEDGHEKRVRTSKLESAMDKIRSKYGRDAIAFGSTVNKDIFGTHETEE